MSKDASNRGNGENKQFWLSPWRLYQYQKPNITVVLSLIPVMAASIYFFGWRSLMVAVWCVAVGTFTEWLFCRSRGEKVSSAVLVTSLLFALILPPTVPLSVAAVGIVIAIVFGKEVFGGFGRNIYNPALVGRCFVYICFPVAMTSQWLPAFSSGAGGVARWTGSADSITRATPLIQYKAQEGAAQLQDMLFGNVAGSMGATSSLVIIIAGAYLIYKKTANWQIMASCLVGGLVTSTLFHYVVGSPTVPGPLFTVLAGGFLFGTVFMATDPISSSSTKGGRIIYGVSIGVLTVIIRGFSNFPEGIMFAIVLMNTFVPITDHFVREFGKWRKARQQAQAEGAQS